MQRHDLEGALAAAGLRKDADHAGWRGVYVRGRRCVLLHSSKEAALLTSRDPDDVVPQWPLAFETTLENALAWATDGVGYDEKLCGVVKCTERARHMAMR